MRAIRGGTKMEKSGVVNEVVWKGEVTFQGTVDEFKAFTSALTAHPVSITVAETLGRLGANAGYMRIPEYETVVGKSMVETLQREAVPLPLPPFIAGGIRTPHFHAGQQALLVSKEQFKAFLGDVARKMTEDHVEAETDFYNMIKPLAK